MSVCLMPGSQLCMDVCAVGAGTRSFSLEWCWCLGGASAILPHSQLPVLPNLPSYLGAKCFVHLPLLPMDSLQNARHLSQSKLRPTFYQGQTAEYRHSIFICFCTWCIKKEESSTAVPHWNQEQSAKRVKHGKDIPLEQTCRGRLKHTF